MGRRWVPAVVYRVAFQVRAQVSGGLVVLMRDGMRLSGSSASSSGVVHGVESVACLLHSLFILLNLLSLQRREKKSGWGGGGGCEGESVREGERTRETDREGGGGVDWADVARVNARGLCGLRQKQAASCFPSTQPSSFSFAGISHPMTIMLPGDTYRASPVPVGRDSRL